MATDITIFAEAGAGGWTVLGHLHRALARLTGGTAVVLPAGRPSRGVRAVNLLRGRRAGGEVGLLVARSAADLLDVHQVAGWRTRFRVLAAYVIDCWYTEWSSWEARLFDHLFVSQLADVAPVARRTGRPTHYLPLGADVVGAGQGKSTDRPIDLLAYGRQPPGCSYDLLRPAAERAGLVLQPHVPFDPDPDQSQEQLYAAAGRSKFALGFCNSIHYYAGLPPRTPFLTFRWFDNLAAGATLVGVLPRPAGFAEVVGWDGAYLDLPPDLAPGLALLTDHCRRYDPRIWLRNHYESLVRNDWRLRLRDSFNAIGVPLPPPLAIELGRPARYRDELAGLLGLPPTGGDAPPGGGGGP